MGFLLDNFDASRKYGGKAPLEEQPQWIQDWVALNEEKFKGWMETAEGQREVMEHIIQRERMLFNTQHKWTETKKRAAHIERGLAIWIELLADPSKSERVVREMTQLLEWLKEHSDG